MKSARSPIPIPLLRREDGQVSLMVGIMMLTFLFFFCFVVNVGMLVNAKINLQNAADLAAYSGAAVQARQLNLISALNYEMRRQYKKFLFRYYVIGNMSQAGAPKDITAEGKTPRVWSPDGKKDYGIPVVCMIFNTNDNYCQIAVSKAIASPPESKNDMIQSALIKELKNFENQRQKNCEKIAITNQLTLQLWLWNTDPQHKKILESATPEMHDTVSIITGLAQGLGLIPKNLLLRMRIKTIEEYLNSPAQTEINLEAAQNLKDSSDDPSSKERTIQAFYSALYTLGNHTFPTDQISMDEILPNQEVVLKDIKARFEAYALKLDQNADAKKTAGVDDKIEAKDCVPTITPEQLKQPVILGVSKDPKVLTYYAIRLKAKAKLLFSPWGDLDLKAYSAAQPFGSRIGPDLQEADWVRTKVEPGIGMDSSLSTAGGGGTAFSLLGQIPNLPVTLHDSTAKGNGWDTTQVIGTMYGSSFSSTLASIQTNDLERAYQIAMAPNPWESGYYNIPNDLDAKNFAPLFDGREEWVAWAPIVSPEHPGSVDAQVQSLLDDLFTETTPDSLEFKRVMKEQIANYLLQLKNGQGEQGEGMNLVRISNPFYERYLGGNQPLKPLGLPEWIMPKDPGDIMTSWNHPNDASTRTEDAKQGRNGYSVKFVSFDSLVGSESRTPASKSEMWTNDLNVDDEANADLPWIKH